MTELVDIEWDEDYQSPDAIRRHYDALRAANPDFGAIHRLGFQKARRLTLRGDFDGCASCGHERQSHYDGGNCGESECPTNCAEFAATEPVR